MPHPAEHTQAGAPLRSEEAESLAEMMRAFGAASRLRLLFALVGGARTVEQLAGLAELQMSAASHQLRILRALKLVRVRREGRLALYSLHDHHVEQLLSAVRAHREHVHPPTTDELAAPPSTTAAA